MTRLRIQGLVRVADRTRRALTAPLTADHLARIRKTVLDAIRTVDALVSKHGSRVEHLPGPTRNAYHYLAGINWEAVQQQPTGTPSEPAKASIRYTGLSSFFEKLLHQLGGPESDANAPLAYQAIQRTAQRLANGLERDRVDRSHLTAESRGILAWLTYFAQQAHFERLLDAIRHAREALTAEIQRSEAFELPIVVHFRPMKGLYRVRRFQDATLVQLPTPMICFGRDDITCLAMAVCGDKESRRPVLERTASPEYQALLAELDGAVGGERAGGAFHDLDAAFRRVSQVYFGGAVAKPRLTWSRRITSCKFGHYDPLRDELMVSATLDSREVPEYVVDFIVYHELLHKKHGTSWHNGRQAVHTEAFREDERRFAEFNAADGAIKALAKRLATGSPKSGFGAVTVPVTRTGLEDM